MEGADATPRFLEGLLEAMSQSFYGRFGGLSKLTKGWTGVYMADWGGRMRTRTAMLEISWLPRSLEGAHASFWPANMCVCLFSWVARVFLLLGPRAHLVFYALVESTRCMHCKAMQVMVSSKPYNASLIISHPLH